MLFKELGHELARLGLAVAAHNFSSLAVVMELVELFLVWFEMSD